MCILPQHHTSVSSGSFPFQPFSCEEKVGNVPTRLSSASQLQFQEERVYPCTEAQKPQHSFTQLLILWGLCKRHSNEEHRDEERESDAHALLVGVGGFDRGCASPTP